MLGLAVRLSHALQNTSFGSLISESPLVFTAHDYLSYISESSFTLLTLIMCEFFSFCHNNQIRQQNSTSILPYFWTDHISDIPTLFD